MFSIELGKLWKIIWEHLCFCLGSEESSGENNKTCRSFLSVMFFLRRTSRAANNAGICDVFYFFRVHPYPKMNQTPFLPQVFDFRSKTLYLQYFVIKKKRQSTLVLQFVCNFLPAAHHSIAAKTLVFAMRSFQASHKIQKTCPNSKISVKF